MLRLLKKTIKFLFSIFLIFGSFFLFIYLIYFPNTDKIRILQSELNFLQLSRNTTLSLMTDISKPVSEEELLSQNETINSIEHVDPVALLKMQNEGKTLDYVQNINTFISIPSVDIEGRIYDGFDSYTMMYGIWHFPLSSVPGKKGNTVFIAHRFAKLPPSKDTFFNLDKTKVGDIIIIKNDFETLNYTVTEVKVVEKENRTILLPTNDYRITLITCTPLWTDHQRLVVVAKLDKVRENV